MKITTCTLETCSTARGTVVAVDVVRAFTTAAFAFDAGAEKILLAGSVEEALALRERHPGSLVMGELGGLPVEGFDLWNSPAQLAGKDLRGKTLVQRTSSGTQGIVRSRRAKQLFAASFVVARATAQAIRSSGAAEVTFVITGQRTGEPLSGVEDEACAAYIGALLQEESPTPRACLAWADAFLEERLPGASEDLRRSFATDLKYCTQIDRFPFALRIHRRRGLLVMEKTT